MSGGKNEAGRLRDTFLASRNGAILRCAGIMIDSGRKDLARQILQTTRIDRKRLEEIRFRAGE